MSDDEINISIAEACGWKVHPKDKWVVIPPNSPHSGQPLYTLPKYCDDLNAMHEAEQMLTEIQCAFYRSNLREIITDIPSSRFVWHATARQRAEAFLRTVGKWEEAAK